MTNTMMYLPDTLEEFMEQYKVVDTEQIYTNGTELVPIFRIKQWFISHPCEPPRWIPVTERLPEKDNHCVLVTYKDGNDYFVKQMYYGKAYFERSSKICFYDSDSEYGDVEYRGVIAWMPLPTPYKGGEKE